MIVTDTNVVSALMSSSALAELEPWFARIRTTELFTTTITRAEIRFAIACLPDGARKASLTQDADAYFTTVADRMLPFDESAADAFGEVAAERRRIGRPISTADAQIAAIALVRGAMVATRNVRDFEGVGLTLINPWEIQP